MTRYDVVTLEGTTDGSGDATVDSRAVTGEVVYVEVEGAALTDSANLVLSTLLTEVAGTTEVGETIINHADVGNASVDKLYPARFLQDNAGAALAVAVGVSAPCRYFVPGAKLRAVISAGGATKAFRVRVWLA